MAQIVKYQNFPLINDAEFLTFTCCFPLFQVSVLRLGKSWNVILWLINGKELHFSNAIIVHLNETISFHWWNISSTNYMGSFFGVHTSALILMIITLSWQTHLWWEMWSKTHREVKLCSQSERSNLFRFYLTKYEQFKIVKEYILYMFSYDDWKQCIQPVYEYSVNTSQDTLVPSTNCTVA